jgi:hypothetical protein
VRPVLRPTSAAGSIVTLAADGSGTDDVRVLLGLILIVLAVVVPGAYLVWRFKRGEEAESGGSDGAQLLGREKDDWDHR